LNRIKTNIIKANAIPRKIVLRKLSSTFFRKKKKHINISDEFTFSSIGKDNSCKPNYKPFVCLLPAPEEIENSIDELAKYCMPLLSHKFALLGSSEVDNNLQIDRNEFVKKNINPANQERASELLGLLPDDYNLLNWQCDFKSGYSWDSSIKSEYLKYQNLHGSDVKIPWELGRLQHFIPLAYLATAGKEEFEIELKSQIIDFIACNPPSYGIQWKSTMDVAIRAISLIFSVSVLSKYTSTIDEDIDNLIFSYIRLHSEYIFDNLEWNEGLRANHYIFNIVGLLACEIYLSDNFQDSERFDFALSQLRQEILYQFNEDGGNFEASIPYHFFTAQAIFLSNSLLNLCNVELLNSDELKKWFESIIRFTLANADDNGRISQIGDNDSGYLLKIQPADILNTSELSVKYILRYIKKTISKEMYDFPNSGIYIRKNKDMFFTFRCGNVGQRGKGGHAHNDALSFTFRLNGLDFFVDPGTYCYLPEPAIRNKYRSTEYHNTISIKDKEQNLILTNSNDDLFWLIEKAKARIIEASATKLYGIHYGFGNKAERIISLNERQIHCIDRLICTGVCTLSDDKQINFHLHPKVKVISEQDRIILINADTQLNLITGKNKYLISNYYYSSAYGKRENAKKITLFSHSQETEWIIQY